ncbi:acetyltransferase [Bacillus sp. FJAT-18017]|uniref:GNAT family N-acetyltransferase n=1 Tax=Bacillus sp. FJAT-18017 TaxID=1705566 RepID=UPI0006AF97E6|nr:GNAT family N-acetyltransferase [Bacillus sp. FJAT-18017]ALC91769.1 acetyltransferase [Bacillus sp. FJAT-18017]
MEPKIIIRPAKLEDAETVLNIHKSVIAEGLYLTPVSDEFTRTVEEQRDSLRKLVASDREIMIVAEAAGKVVGWVVFYAHQRKRMAHTGYMGIVIQDGYRNLGIGKMLVKALLDWAEQNPMIEKVCLAVFSTNYRAISLYRSMGFIEEGRKIKEYKMDETTYVDDVLMYRLVN